ncbi:unnamed protein product [Diamesa tonsa]
MSQLIDNYWNSIFDVEVTKKEKRDKKLIKSKDISRNESSSKMSVNYKIDSKVNESNNKRKAAENFVSQESKSSKENHSKRIKLDPKVQDSIIQKALTENTDRIMKQVERSDDTRNQGASKLKGLSKTIIMTQDDNLISNIIDSSTEILNTKQEEELLLQNDIAKKRAVEVLKKQRIEKVSGFKPSISVSKNIPFEVLKVKEVVQQNDRILPSVSVTKNETKEVLKMKQDDGLRTSVSVTKPLRKEVLKKKKQDLVKPSISSKTNNLPKEVPKIKLEEKQDARPKPSIPVTKPLLKEKLKKKNDDIVKPSQTNNLPIDVLNNNQNERPRPSVAVIKSLPTEVLLKKQQDPKDDELDLQLIAKKRAIEILKKIKAEAKVAGFKPSISVIKDKPIVAVKKEEMFKQSLEKPRIPEKKQEKQPSEKSRISERKQENLKQLSEKPKVTVKMYNEKYFEKLMGSKENFHGSSEISVKSISDLTARVESVLDWKFVAVESHDTVKRTLYMSRGKCDVVMYNKKKDNWEAIEDIKLEMPADTIVYGEFVTEFNGEGNSQKLKLVFHIIDGIILGGKDIRKLKLTDRNRLCHNFSESILIPESKNKDNSVTIRTKELFNFTSLNVFFHDLTQRKMEKNSKQFGININQDISCKKFFIPSGIMMMTDVRPGIMRCYSKKRDMLYFFDKHTKVSRFEQDALHDNVYASFKDTFMTRFFWNFNNQDQLSDEVPEIKNDNIMYRKDVIDFILSFMP